MLVGSDQDKTKDGGSDLKIEFRMGDYEPERCRDEQKSGALKYKFSGLTVSSIKMALGGMTIFTKSF